MTDETDEDLSMVLVAHAHGKSWVIKDAVWTDDWEQQGNTYISDGKNKYMYDRPRALKLAHDIHNRIKTEYGVWEVFLGPKKQSE